MNKIFSFISFFLLTFPANSQISIQDSLLSLFNNSKEDTSKTKLLIQLGDYYNDIYSEYSTIMLWGGTGFLIYLMVLIIFEIRVMRLKRTHIKNK